MTRAPSSTASGMPPKREPGHEPPAPARRRRQSAAAARGVSPRICEHCGKRVGAALPERVIAAARVIATARGARGTTRDVVAAGLCTHTMRASELLHAAVAAGLLHLVGVQPNGHGRGALLYGASRAEQRRIASYE